MEMLPPGSRRSRAPCAVGALHMHDACQRTRRVWGGSRRARVNCVNARGDTALHAPAAHGHVGCVGALLAAGTIPDTAATSRRTPCARTRSRPRPTWPARPPSGPCCGPPGGASSAAARAWPSAPPPCAHPGRCGGGGRKRDAASHEYRGSGGDPAGGRRGGGDAVAEGPTEAAPLARHPMRCTSWTVGWMVARCAWRWCKQCAGTCRPTRRRGGGQALEDRSPPPPSAHGGRDEGAGLRAQQGRPLRRHVAVRRGGWRRAKVDE